MVAATPLDPLAPLAATPPPDEQRMLLGATWKEYVILRELLDGSGVRMTYSKGALELMSPSREHEVWKTNIARFIEFFAHVRRIRLHGYGSTTFKKEAEERGCEPDESYLIGKKLVNYPEIVLEVIHTSPLVDKLEVYRSFGVAEVWVYRDGKFTLYELDDAGKYATVSASKRVPGLDFELLARLALREDTPDALDEFEAIIRKG